MATYENAQRIALGRALRMMKAKHERLTDGIIEERSGISKATFGRYFRGERDIKMSALMALAEALGTTVVEVVSLAEALRAEAEDEERRPKVNEATR